MNDVMLAIWQQAARFDPSMRFSTWLFSIAHHKALSARAQAGRQALEPPPEVTEQGVQEDPEILVIQQEDTRALAAALATLPPEQRAVVELTYYHYRSYEEIATILECPVNTVKKRMSLARRRLAAHADNGALYLTVTRGADYESARRNSREHIARALSRYGRAVPAVEN